MKRKILVFFSLIFALIATLAVFTACGKTETPLVSGDEVGTYYCEVDGREWTFTLSEECKFTLAMTEEKSGTYKLEGTSLTLLFDGAQDSEYATLENNVLTYVYGNTTYRFLLKTFLTVTFSADGTTFKTESVLNGKPVAKPTDAPEKENYVFVGWYSDSALKNYYNFDRPVTDALTLHARFVEKVVLDPEYTISFDLGYEDAPELPAMETMGGKLYELPVPAREGDTFVGWWASHYNSADMLTYQYNEQEFTEDATLYAVWASDAPYVSIGDKEIVWSAEGVGNSYSVVFKGPDGQDIYNRASSTTSYAFDFANAAEGDYTVAVTLNGHTTTAYYRNKALKKVTGFRVAENTLLFNPVDHATHYTLSFTCGMSSHDHSAVDLGEDTSFNFENCPLPEDGFSFVVTASGEGWMSSVSDAFPFTRTLNAVTDLTVDPKTDHISWTAVDSATSYHITISLNGTELISEDVKDDVLTYDLTGYNVGSYTIAVYPVARTWKSPAASTYDYTKARLATPKNLHLEGVEVVWDVVDGATSYEVKVGDRTYKVETNSLTFTDTVAGQSTYRFSVRALGENDAANSFFSVELTANQGEFADTLVYQAGVLSWDSVFGVSEYMVKVNDGEEFAVTNASSTPITLTKAGENVLSVAAVLAGGNYSAWREVKVNAYAIMFDSQEGAPVPTQYYAIGDPIKLPVPEKTGYTHAGWYETEDGASSGLPFNEPFFTEEMNFTLFAAWTANKYKIVFNVGIYGETLEDGEATYDAGYQLAVPVSRSEEMAFAGWFAQEGGVGLQYTDHEGNSLRPWGNTEPVTLYAKWVEIFKYEKVSDGYAVSAGPGISYVRDIVIPQKHGEETITQLKDFSNSGSLRSVTFHDTVTNITVGSIGIVFAGCTNLADIHVKQVEGTHDARYWSVDGILLGKDTTTGDVIIYYYPARHVLENNVFYVPEGVTKLTAGTFPTGGNSPVIAPDPWTLNEIVVASSVTLVEVNTFSGITSLHTVRFLDPKEGVAQPLTIEEGAFQSLTYLWEVHLPARLASFSSAAFLDVSTSGVSSGLRGLDTVTVAEGGQYFTMVGGLVTRILDGNGRELVYYPLPSNPRGSLTSGNRITENIIIPEGITSIAADAFTKHTTARGNVLYIEIASTVSYIAPYAFSSFESSNNSKGVTTLVFKSTADSVGLTIGEGAFYGNKHLPKEIVLPENLISLGAYAFGGMGDSTNLLTVVANIGANGRVVTLATNSFASNVGTTRYSYVGTVKLGPDAPGIIIADVFGANVKTLVVDPENKNYILRGGIYYGNGNNILFITADAEFTDVTIIDDSVTVIPANQYSGSKITAISLPATLTEIGSQAFYNCSELVSVIFRTRTADGEVPNVPLVIGESAFASCAKLKEITLPEHTVSIGTSAFKGGSSASARAGLESITLNEGLKTIGALAFQNTNLTSIHIPASVESLEVTTETVGIFSSGRTMMMTSMKVFDGATQLKEITVDPKNEYYASKDGVLYGLTEGKLTDLIYLPASCNAVEGVLTVPNTVKKVWSCFMYHNGVKTQGATDGITEMKFEDGVENLVLAPNAFRSMAVMQLSKLTLPHGLTEIGERAFSTGSLLPITSLTIPNTVTRIGAYAFNSNSILTELIFEDGETPLVLEGGGKPATSPTSSPIMASGDEMFGSSSKIATLILPSRLTLIGDHVFNHMTSLTSVNIPKNIRALGDCVFANTTKLENLTLDEGCTLESLGWGTFYCSGITEFTAPKTLKTIGNFSFASSKSAAKLTSVTFPADSVLESIGISAFNEAKFTSISFPATLKTIGEQAFGYANNTNSNCPNLETVIFAENNNLERIDSLAFGYCQNLKTVNFGTPLNPFTIGERAFAGTALEEISFPATLKQIDDGTATNGAFYNSTKLSKVTFANGILAYIGNYAFAKTAVTNLVFPASSTEIKLGTNILDGVTEPITVHFSAQVFSISGAFTNNTFNDITIDPANQYLFKDTNNQPIIYDKEGSILLIYGEISGRIEMKNGALTIGAGAFQNQKGITEIVIPASVIEIGANAFNGCTDLTKVTFASNSALATIGANAFDGCTELKTINFDQTSRISSLGAYAFRNCSSLRTVDLSRNTELTALGNYAFQNTRALGAEGDDYLSLPASLTHLGTYTFQNSGIRTLNLTALKSLTKISSSATLNVSITTNVYTFDGCKNLASVTLPSSLEQIGGYAFQNCENLSSINLDGVTLVAQYAFFNCGFVTLTLPNLVVTGYVTSSGGGTSAIGQYAFASNKKLVALNIAEGQNAFYAYAFKDCTALTSITFPESFTLSNVATSTLNYMGYFHMFEGCTGLTSVTFKGKVEKMPRYMFAGCKSLKTINLEKGCMAFDQYAFQNCEALESFTIPADTETIDTYVFTGTGLKSLSILASTLSIGNYAFQNCEALSQISFPQDTSDITFGNYVFQNCGFTSFEIPNAKAIGTYFLAKNAQLTSVTFAPDFNLATLPNYMFQECKSLKSFTFPSCVTNTGTNTFQNCGLESITIPSTLTTLGNYVFDGNTSLSSVTFAGGTADISFGNYVFQNCGFTSFEIPNAKAIGSYFLAKNAKLANVTFAQDFNLATLPNYMLNTCPELKSINLPACVTNTGTNTFQNCTGITSFTIPVAVKTLGNYVFDGCTSLSSVTYLGNVEDITFGNYVFQNCAFTSFEIPKAKAIGTHFLSKNTKLTKVTFADGVTAIPNYMFYYCSALVDIELPKGLVTIGTYAFESCTSLTSFVVPDSVTSMGATTATAAGRTFYGCTSLKSVVIGNGVKILGTYTFYGCTALETVVIGTSVTNINNYSFQNCNALKAICFASGTEQTITVGATQNAVYTNAPKYYYSQQAPTTAGNFWHYDAEGNIAFWGSSDDKD